jgi:hypothetical protein
MKYSDLPKGTYQLKMVRVYFRKDGKITQLCKVIPTGQYLSFTIKPVDFPRRKK